MMSVMQKQYTYKNPLILNTKGFYKGKKQLEISSQSDNEVSTWC